MSDPLAPLRDRFRARAAADRATLEVLVQGDQTSPELRRLVHNLAGAAGMFGYQPLGRIAARIDDRMAEGLPPDAASLDQLKASLDAVNRPPSMPGEGRPESESPG